ncbi:MAG: Asp-tRNA(Asn)/Glu-tRNA(Gln) amidotransferase subunit GatC [Chloroflexi bacterium]|nr:Asp-tRNA(Asn)/Glu-tRNA(Gln) amidotransferase subunit GatC [Chloroflexota bacterium]MCI0846021.1 Asp-tRNA(Asn)/Glu-tRNA(Gln) amidotransferase subunit GatC [Chloroflexota bacterium]
MALDAALVQHLATLVRIGLSEEELETLREQLSHILEQFEVLSELDPAALTANVQAQDLPHGSGVMREDVAADSLEPAEVLQNAPRLEGEFFRVKVVLEE